MESSTTAGYGKASQECGRIDGYLRVDTVDVTYRALGRTRHATVPLGMPFVVTTRDLDEIRTEIVASLDR